MNTQTETIFERLRHDHDRQRRLIDDLVETQGDSAERRDAFDELKRELEAHAKHEERHFYVPLMEHDHTQEKARHSISEHRDIDDLVEKLVEYDMSAPQWLLTATELRDQLVHHLDEEEHEVFQVAGKILDDHQKRTLAAEYEAGMADERARPR